MTSNQPPPPKDAWMFKPESKKVGGGGGGLFKSLKGNSWNKRHIFVNNGNVCYGSKERQAKEQVPIKSLLVVERLAPATAKAANAPPTLVNFCWHFTTAQKDILWAAENDKVCAAWVAFLQQMTKGPEEKKKQQDAAADDDDDGFDICDDPETEERKEAEKEAEKEAKQEEPQQKEEEPQKKQEEKVEEQKPGSGKRTPTPVENPSKKNGERPTTPASPALGASFADPEEIKRLERECSDRNLVRNWIKNQTAESIDKDEEDRRQRIAKEEESLREDLEDERDDSETAAHQATKERLDTEEQKKLEDESLEAREAIKKEQDEERKGHADEATASAKAARKATNERKGAELAARQDCKRDEEQQRGSLTQEESAERRQLVKDRNASADATKQAEEDREKEERERWLKRAAAELDVAEEDARAEIDEAEQQDREACAAEAQASAAAAEEATRQREDTEREARGALEADAEGAHDAVVSEEADERSQLEQEQAASAAVAQQATDDRLAAEKTARGELEEHEATNRQAINSDEVSEHFQMLEENIAAAAAAEEAAKEREDAEEERMKQLAEQSLERALAGLESDEEQARASAQADEDEKRSELADEAAASTAEAESAASKREAAELERIQKVAAEALAGAVAQLEEEARIGEERIHAEETQERDELVSQEQGSKVLLDIQATETQAREDVLIDAATKTTDIMKEATEADEEITRRLRVAAPLALERTAESWQFLHDICATHNDELVTASTELLSIWSQILELLQSEDALRSAAVEESAAFFDHLTFKEFHDREVTLRNELDFAGLFFVPNLEILNTCMLSEIMLRHRATESEATERLEMRSELLAKHEVELRERVENEWAKSSWHSLEHRWARLQLECIEETQRRDFEATEKIDFLSVLASSQESSAQANSQICLLEEERERAEIDKDEHDAAHYLFACGDMVVSEETQRRDFEATEKIDFLSVLASSQESSAQANSQICLLEEERERAEIDKDEHDAAHYLFACGDMVVSEDAQRADAASEHDSELLAILDKHVDQMETLVRTAITDEEDESFSQIQQSFTNEEKEQLQHQFEEEIEEEPVEDNEAEEKQQQKEEAEVAPEAEEEQEQKEGTEVAPEAEEQQQQQQEETEVAPGTEEQQQQKEETELAPEAEEEQEQKEEAEVAPEAEEEQEAEKDEEALDNAQGEVDEEEEQQPEQATVAVAAEPTTSSEPQTQEQNEEEQPVVELTQEEEAQKDTAEEKADEEKKEEQDEEDVDLDNELGWNDDDKTKDEAPQREEQTQQRDARQEEDEEEDDEHDDYDNVDDFYSMTRDDDNDGEETTDEETGVPLDPRTVSIVQKGAWIFKPASLEGGKKRSFFQSLAAWKKRYVRIDTAAATFWYGADPKNPNHSLAVTGVTDCAKATAAEMKNEGAPAEVRASGLKLTVEKRLFYFGFQHVVDLNAFYDFFCDWIAQAERRVASARKRASGSKRKSREQKQRQKQEAAATQQHNGSIAAQGRDEEGPEPATAAAKRVTILDPDQAVDQAALHEQGEAEEGQAQRKPRGPTVFSHYDSCGWLVPIPQLPGVGDDPDDAALSGNRPSLHRVNNAKNKRSASDYFEGMQKLHDQIYCTFDSAFAPPSSANIAVGAVIGDFDGLCVEARGNIDTRHCGLASSMMRTAGVLGPRPTSIVIESDARVIVMGMHDDEEEQELDLVEEEEENECHEQTHQQQQQQQQKDEPDANEEEQNQEGADADEQPREEEEQGANDNQADGENVASAPPAGAAVSAQTVRKIIRKARVAGLISTVIWATN